MFVKSYHSPQFLRKMSKSRKYLHSKDRVRAVYLAMKNHSLNQIVKILDRSRGSVRKWVRTYNNQGLELILEKKKNIRKTKLLDHHKEEFILRVCSGPTKADRVNSFTLEDIQRIFLKKLSCSIPNIWHSKASEKFKDLLYKTKTCSLKGG